MGKLVSSQSWLGNHESLVMSCKPVVIQQGREYESKEIIIVRSRYQVMTREDITGWKDLECAAVIRRLYRIVRVL
jgi:hypothetical protein